MRRAAPATDGCCRPGRRLAVFTGPPRDPKLDADFVSRFLASPGYKVVCGATTADIVLTPFDDTLLEGDESVVLTLSPGAAYNVGTPGSATRLNSLKTMLRLFMFIFSRAPASVGQSNGWPPRRQ